MKIRLVAQPVARWSMLILAACIPVSVALGNVLLAVLLLCGLTAYTKEIWLCIKTHPVARAGALLFLALLLGCFMDLAALGDALAMLSKYMDVAFAALFLVMFKDRALRQRAESGLLVMMLITAVFSWLVGLRVLSESFCLWSGCSAENPSIFLNHIAHNLMMAFATFLLALRARAENSARIKWLYASLALFTGADVLFLVQGRIGYVVLGVLFAYFVWSTLNQRLQRQDRSLSWREYVGFISIVVLTAWSAYQLSPRLQERVDLIVTESSAWEVGTRSETSTGLRLEFYSNTASIIAEHPLFGVGTGGFAEAYRQQVESSGMIATRNPHNEFLHLTAQLGIMGLLLFLYLLYTQWRTALQLHDARIKDAAIGLMLTLLVTSLFNTPLMDHTEGLFFAYMSALYFSSYTPKVKDA